VKKVYQQVDFALVDGKVEIKNLYCYTNLKDMFDLKMILSVKGEEVDSVTNEMPSVAPFETVSVDIPFTVSEDDTYLTVQAIQKDSDRGIEKGHVVAEEQLELAPYKKKKFKASEGKSIAEDDNTLTLDAGRLVAVVDKKSGYIESVKKDGLELISAHIKPNFWRAPTDNDFVPHIGNGLKKLIGVHFYKRTTNDMVRTTLKVDDKCVEVRWQSSVMPILRARYKVGEDQIRISMKCRGILFGLPRFGFKTKLQVSDDVTFYGRGKHENYCDRKTGAFLNTYTGKVEDFEHGYLYPQENGNHCDVRRVTIGGEKGLTFEALSRPFEFSCHKYSIDALEKARHLHELHNEEDGVYVYIDGKQRGVGGDLPAIACTKKKHKIPANKTHKFEFIIK
jgi:beta-galactosidase